MDDVLLPPLNEGDYLDCVQVSPKEHKTNPPARYSEASFVKELEACGVGRPSTYASIIDTLVNRKYINVEKGALVPTVASFVVTDLLEEHCPDFVDTGGVVYGAARVGFWVKFRWAGVRWHHNWYLTRRVAHPHSLHSLHHLQPPFTQPAPPTSPPFPHV